MQTIGYTSKKWHVVLAAILIFISAKPFYVWGFINKPFVDYALKTLIFFLFYSNKSSNRSGIAIISIYAITIIWDMLIGQFHGENIFGLIAHGFDFMLISILFARKEFLKEVYNSLKALFVGVLILSLINLILSMYMSPMGIIEHFTQQDRLYTYYPFLVIEQRLTSFSDYFRFFGVFDEPGQLGTFCAFFLCIEKFNIKDWKNVVILVSGILTMSFFFYGAVAVYTVFYLVTVKRKFGYTILFAVAIFAFYLLTKDNDLMHQMIWRRFEWDAAEHTFAGDNRMNEEGAYYFDTFIRHTRQYWFGVDNLSAYWGAAYGGSSYKDVIAAKGVIFLFLYTLTFVVAAYKNRSNFSDFLLAVFLILLNTYQRPDIYYSSMIFLYTCFTFKIYESSLDNNQSVS